jgi:hypothetical protein
MSESSCAAAGHAKAAKSAADSEDNLMMEGQCARGVRPQIQESQTKETRVVEQKL